MPKEQLSARPPLLEEARQQGFAAFPCCMYIADAASQKDGTAFITKMHWHSSIEFLHFKEGHFTVTIDMETYEITEECYAIVESGCMHNIHSERDYKESALLFSPAILSARSIDAAENNLVAPLMNGSLCMPKLITKDMDGYEDFDRFYQAVFHIFMDIGLKREDQYIVTEAAGQLSVRAYLMLILAGLQRAHLLSNEMHIPNPKAEALKQVLNYIEQHYTEKIYIRELAHLMNLNEQYFSRFFKKVIGKTPVEYINDVRIRHAANLLKNTTDPILDVALASGFGNVGNFIEIFKRQTGQKPLEYRNLNRS